MAGCRPLTDDEVAAMTKAFCGQYAARNYAMFALGVCSGLRISELLSLRLGQVVQNGVVVRYVVVPRRLMKGGRSRDARGRPRRPTASGRSVLLHPEARRALKAWLIVLTREMGYMTRGCWVFQSRSGPNRPISRQQAWRILVEAARSARVELTRIGTHSLRKTFAARVGRGLARVGRNPADTLRLLQEALGHRSVDSTAAYVEVDREEVEEAILNA